MESNVAFAAASEPTGQAELCARLLLDVVPGVMKAIRMEMRSSKTPDLTVARFRTLWCLSHNRGQSLSEVADSIGLALPSMSKLIDGLINRGLVRRTSHKSDRRRIVLSATDKGERILTAAKETTRQQLLEQIASLGTKDLDLICRAMDVLRPIFASWLNDSPKQLP